MLHRILLIDNCQIVRSSLAAILDASGRFKVVAEAEGPSQALEHYQATLPDVVLLGPGCVNADRRNIIIGLLAHSPNSRIVTILLHDDETVGEVLRMGVLGVIGRGASVNSLQEVLARAADGDTHHDTHYFSSFRLRHLEKSSRERSGRLAPRELQVLGLISQGMSSKEIANSIALSVETVRYYRKSLMRKLNVHNVAALLNAAITSELISDPRAASIGNSPGRRNEMLTTG